MSAPRLVPRPPVALVTSAVGTVVVVVLALLFHGDRQASAFDRALDRAAEGLPTWFTSAVLHLTDPPLVIGLCVSFVLVGVLVRRWDLAVLAALAPLTAIGVTEFLLKPLVHRTKLIDVGRPTQHRSLAFPSGHETLLTALACAVVVLVLSAGVARRAAALTLSVVTVVAVLGGVGLVAASYHYATDVIGAIALTTATVPAVALAVDRLHDTFGGFSADPQRIRQKREVS